MRKFILIALAIEFFVWLLPLGAFIDPSKEGWICGGQRAVCLCSLILKSQSKRRTIILFKSNSETQKEKLSPSSSEYLPSASVEDFKNLREGLALAQDQLLRDLLVCRSIEHVPKI